MSPVLLFDTWVYNSNVMNTLTYIEPSPETEKLIKELVYAWRTTLIAMADK